MTMENSSRPMTSHPVHVTSHPALMHVGGMDLVGNYRTSHGSGTVFLFFNLCYRPQTKLREGYVFTGVCDSVHEGGEDLGRYTPGTRYTHPPTPTPLGTRYTPPGPGTPQRPGNPPDQVHPSGAVHAGRYGQQAGSMHPTGMHSNICGNKKAFQSNANHPACTNFIMNKFEHV